jgi:hypothetical protein
MESMMAMLLSDMLSQSDTGQYLTQRQLSKFSAQEIRQTIASLVSGGQMDLADALSAAGLSLYPDSEDILAISALLSEIKLDWKTAEELLSHLMTLQADAVKPMTWLHLIRVIRCQSEFGRALLKAKQAVAIYPEDPALQNEFLSLQDLVSAETPDLATPHLH